MNFKVKIPARINVLGNPSDANEGDHQTISAAIDLFGEVYCENADKLTFEFLDKPIEEGGKTVSAFVVSSAADLEYGDERDLLKSAVNILLKYSAEFREAYRARSPRMRFYTEIPRQSGLGGSTVLLLLALVSLAQFYKLDKRKHNLYALAELAQRAEENELGITCGFADRYVPLFGDIAYIDYRGKLFHKPIFEEPLATYEKLGRFVTDFPLVLVYTGVEHDSGNVHGRLRSRYLEEYSLFKGDYDNAPPLVQIMKQVGDTAWKGKIALLEGDWERFGLLMNENHRLVDEMMRYCGFSSGAGEANNRLIRAGLDAGALGAKLAGAGAGGSVFFLTRPGTEKKLAISMEKILSENNYRNGRVYIPSIVAGGMVITK